MKKLTLGKSKSHRMHIQFGKKHKLECAQLKVHDEIMETTETEKYLGDFVSNSGKIDKTIEDRKNKGYAMMSQIMAILEEIPLGRHRIEIGLLLRKTMLTSCMLFNSEVWHCITDKHIKQLEKVDEQLLRRILYAHSKTPIEILYLETGALPIRFTLSYRRLLYVHTLMHRNENELTKKVYFAQKESPVKGDFCHLVKDDLDLVEINEQSILQMSKSEFKTKLKDAIFRKAFSHLSTLKEAHSKVKNIEHNKLEIQSYFTSPLFSNAETSLLFKLRTQFIECKVNFKHMYSNNNLECPLCKKHNDDQKHILNCEIIRNEICTKKIMNTSIKYEDIYSDDTVKQKEVTEVFSTCLRIRKKLIRNLSSLQDLSTLRGAGG